MKIFFIHSKRLPKDVIKAIEETIAGSGNTILKRENSVVDTQTYNFEVARRTYVNNTKSLKSCDIVIAECSYSSSGIGYEVSQAIEEKKPVIALYNLSIDIENPNHVGKIPSTFKGNTSKYILLKQYDSVHGIKKTIELGLNDAKSLVDTKFILIIPPHIDQYLEWNVKEKGKPKAEITREAIEKVIGEDKRYQDYLKDNKISE